MVHPRTAALAGAVAIAAAALAAPATASAAEPIAGGTVVDIDQGTTGVARCTIGVAGWDAAGNAIALTAGHCSQDLGEVVSIVDPDGTHPVGMVVARNEILDYTVIQLNPNLVTPVRQPGVDGFAPMPAFGATACKQGATTGYTCGVTWQSDDTAMWTQTCAYHGDSGGPMTVGNQLVALVEGAGAPPASGSLADPMDNLLPGCMTPGFGQVFLPTISRGILPIIGDMTARGWPGAGFRLP